MDILMDQLITKIRQMGKYKEFVRDFFNLQTERDHIIFTFNIMLECDIIPFPIDTPKNLESSNRVRREGNELFLKEPTNNGQCIEAMFLYTDSIALAPYPSTALAFGYANRSAVFYQLGLLSECIQDIDKLQDLDYPDILRARLSVRKIYCSIILGHKPIEDKIKKTQKYIKNLSLDDEYKKKLLLKLSILFDKEITKNIKEMAEKKLPTRLKKSEQPLPSIESYNKEIPYASDAVALKYNERYGKHIVATRDISPGEVIVIEKPYASILDIKNKATHCSNCLKQCWTGIPCKFCTNVMYCSNKCKNIAWKKCHDIECATFSVMSTAIWTNFDFFSVRLAVLAVKEAGDVKKLRTMLIKNVNESKDPRTNSFSEDGQLHSDKYISIYNLVTHCRKRYLTDIFAKSLSACFSLYYLVTRTQILGKKLSEDLNIVMKDDDAIFLGSLILRHQQIISCNAADMREVRQIMYVRAVILLPFYACINHSCNHNIIRQSRSEHVVLYAARPIRKNEQIFDCYQSDYSFTPKAERQEKLSTYYFFHCDCIACKEDWPTYEEMPLYEMLVNKKTKKKIRKQLQKLESYFEEAAKHSLIVQNNPEAITDLISMIQILWDKVQEPCSEKVEIFATLEKIYDLHGNRYELPIETDQALWREKLPTFYDF